MITKLDAIQFDKLLAQQDTLRQRACRFDLRGISFISPFDLAQLEASCYVAARDGRQPVIAVDDDGVRSYLIRSDVATVVAGIAQFEPPIPVAYRMLCENLRGGSPMLLKVTKIEDGAVLPELLTKVVHILRRRLRYPKHDAFDIGIAVSEICQNAFDHHGQTFGFLAMQVYGSGPARFLEIGVADCGAGLLATLTRNPRFASLTSDLAAIEHATMSEASAYDDQTRGTGLFHLLKTAYKHQGSVHLRSGTAKVRYRMDRRQGWAFQVPYLPGVQGRARFQHLHPQPPVIFRHGLMALVLLRPFARQPESGLSGTRGRWPAPYPVDYL